MDFKDWFDAIFNKLLKNFVWIATIAGIICMVIGLVIKLTDSSDNIFSVFFVDIGSVVLGAGIFSGAIKSKLFTEIFQKNIVEVLYSPDKFMNKTAMVERWRTLTESLLTTTIPGSFLKKVTNHIQSKVSPIDLNDSTFTYHFHEYSLTYDIEIKDNVASITCITDTKIILSPETLLPESKRLPILRQSIETNGIMEEPQILLNGNVYNFNDADLDKHNQVININLKDHIEEYDASREMCVKFEKTQKWTQDLKKEAHIIVWTTRYAKGFTVKAKVKDKTNLMVFDTIGLSDSPVPIQNNGYTRWQLAAKEELLLLGQGYILMILPN